MTNFQSRLLQTAVAKRKRKQNGFTLIELMVVVAIVGVLTAVGLPELSKAQDKAKDSSAVATLTNAAKECSLNLLTETAADADTQFTAKQATGEVFEGVSGDCEEDTSLTFTSESGNFIYTVEFTGSTPNAATKAAVGAGST